MTKWEALIACRNHWQWLLITGSSHKADYQKCLGWDWQCACCEYVGVRIDIDGECLDCPLSGFAWGLEGRISCEVDESSFFRWWNDAEDEDNRIFCASRMVYACNKAIEAMILKGKA